MDTLRNDGGGNFNFSGITSFLESGKLGCGDMGLAIGAVAVVNGAHTAAVARGLESGAIFFAKPRSAGGQFGLPSFFHGHSLEEDFFQKVYKKGDQSEMGMALRLMKAREKRKIGRMMTARAILSSRLARISENAT